MHKQDKRLKKAKQLNIIIITKEQNNQQTMKKEIMK